MKQITYSKAALRALDRLPANVARLILSKIEQYVREPASQRNNVKRLKGEDHVFRLRVGDWRVIFTESGVIVAVIRIAPRSGAYQ